MLLPLILIEDSPIGENFSGYSGGLRIEKNRRSIRSELFYDFFEKYATFGCSFSHFLPKNNAENGISETDLDGEGIHLKNFNAFLLKYSENFHK